MSLIMIYIVSDYALASGAVAFDLIGWLYDLAIWQHGFLGEI